ncbi:hypothetical protein K1719_041067 [Acacia pycnantha]|nr:hypothetical protein K1719_041067 [Acacia pycnantha]
MGTFNGSKPPSYVLAADNISPDSLSFSGLLSIQDQQSKSPSVTLNQTKQHDQTTNQSPEFEFIVTKPAPKSAAVNSVKKTKPQPANQLIAIEKSQAQAIPFQPNHTDHHHHNSSLSSLLSAHHCNGQRVGPAMPLRQKPKFTDTKFTPHWNKQLSKILKEHSTFLTNC